MKKKALVLLGVVLPVLVAVGVAAASGLFATREPRPTGSTTSTQRSRPATASVCPTWPGSRASLQPGRGGMGVHMRQPVAPGRRARRGEAGGRSSTSREQAGPAEARRARVRRLRVQPGRARPSRSCSGRSSTRCLPGNRYGLPAFYALHAWIWKAQPERDPLRLEPARSTARKRAAYAAAGASAPAAASCSPNFARWTNCPTPGLPTTSPPSTITFPRRSTVSMSPTTSVPS